MASIRVRIEDFEDGVYPDVCASSGATGGTRLYRADISSRVGWVWLLLLGGPVGLLAAIVLSVVLRKTAKGYLSYTDAVQRRIRRRSQRMLWGVVASLAVVAGSLLLSTAGTSAYRGLAVAGFAGGVLGVVVFAFFWSNPPGSVGGALDSTGRWIDLDPVSTRFADAYEQQEARRRAARRAGSSGDVTVW
jgi:hypothetical protein